MIVLASVFPNAPIIGELEEDPAEGDTERVEGMTGEYFTNARRTVMTRRFRFTLWDRQNSDTIQDAIAVKAEAAGALYGFKWTNPRTDEELDVCFTSDNWTLKIEAGETVADTFVKIAIELEEVINGVPAT